MQIEGNELASYSTSGLSGCCCNTIRRPMQIQLTPEELTQLSELDDDAKAFESTIKKAMTEFVKIEKMFIQDKRTIWTTLAEKYQLSLSRNWIVDKQAGTMSDEEKPNESKLTI